jgi:nucleotide-binding universal stress UspA family protein
MTIAEASTRITLKNILFATDFSPAANVAFQYAGDLAQRFGAKLYALHVKEPPNYALSSESFPTDDESCENQTLELRKTLLSKFPGLENEILIGEGNVWQVVASTVDKNEIDLIVVGTGGRAGVRKPLGGSQAEEILRHVRCPVLVVGPRNQLKIEAGEKLAELVYATDFGPDLATRCWRRSTRGT